MLSKTCTCEGYYSFLFFFSVRNASLLLATITWRVYIQQQKYTLVPKIDYLWSAMQCCHNNVATFNFLFTLGIYCRIARLGFDIGIGLSELVKQLSAVINLQCIHAYIYIHTYIHVFPYTCVLQPQKLTIATANRLCDCNVSLSDRHLLAY